MELTTPLPSMESTLHASKQPPNTCLPCDRQHSELTRAYCLVSMPASVMYTNLERGGEPPLTAWPRQTYQAVVHQVLRPPHELTAA